MGGGGRGGRAESRSCVNSKVRPLGSRRREVGLLLQVVLTTVVSVDAVSVTVFHTTAETLTPSLPQPVKISGLKDARTRRQTVYFTVL